MERPLSVKSLHRALPTVAPEQIASWLDAGKGGPVARSATVIETVLAKHPREGTAALVLAEAVLAQALGWTHMVPLFSAGLKRADLGQTGEALHLACHRAVVASAGEAARLAVDLTHRANRLKVVAPKLRAKGAEEALELFLTRDAVTPSALTSLNSDRAARRFCDRLVELGAIRELTGRETFRIYGV